MVATTKRAPLRIAPTTQNWDPLVRPIAVVALATLLILNSAGIGAINGLSIPNSVPLLAGMGALGIAFLIPRPEPIVIPIAPSLLLVMLISSVWWSADPNNAILWLRSDAVVMVGIASLVLVLPNRDVIAALKLFVAAVLAITLLAVSIDPLARIHIDATGEAPPLKGWHGWFIHKNTMAGFMVTALPVVMAFYRSAVARWLGYAAIVVLMVGSDSTTGRAALAVAIAVRAWFGVNRRLSSRGSATFVVSTVALVIVAIAAAIGSLAAIADAAGKDLTFTGRTQIWTAVIDAIGQRPVFGYGVRGLFSPPASPLTSELIRAIGFKAGHAHNGLLDVALQLGVVGVVLVVGLLAGIIRAGLREMRRSYHVPMFALTVAAGLCVASVGESALLNSTVGVVIIVRTLLLRSARSHQRPGMERV